MKPTREQVDKWATDSNGHLIRGVHPGMIGFYPTALEDFATLARADLEAKVAELQKELTETRLQCIADFGQYQEAHDKVATLEEEKRKLIEAVAEHVTVRSEQHSMIVELEAEMARLKDKDDACDEAWFKIDELRQQLASSQLEVNRLRDVLESCPAVYHAAINGKPCTCGMCEFLREKDDALSTSTDDTALREYCAGEVMKVGQYWFSKKDGAGTFEEIAYKIRKGEAL